MFAASRISSSTINTRMKIELSSSDPDASVLRGTNSVAPVNEPLNHHLRKCGPQANIGMQDLLRSAVAPQGACRAKALKIVSTGVSTSRSRSAIQSIRCGSSKHRTADSKEGMGLGRAHQNKRWQKDDNR